MRRLLLLLTALACVAASLTGTGPAASAAVAGDTFRGEDVPLNLRWVPCYTSEPIEFECATARVPLDYDNLEGGKIPLALIRTKATGEKKGSLFFNPGGPGGSGVGFLVDAGPFIYPEIREHYDFVSFDPRGIALSSPLLCFRALGGAVRNFPNSAFPTNAAELRNWRATDNYVRTQCQNNAGIIQNKMSTANVARDLEVMRAAVGDEQLNFIGFSYGTVIGQAYAYLFPDRVGRIVIDAVVNLRDWAGDPSGTDDTVLDVRLQSGKGADDTFADFLRLCDEEGPERCALAPNAADKVYGLLDGLRNQPIVSSEGQVLLTYSNLVGGLLGALYSAFGWADLAAELQAIIDFVDAQAEGSDVQVAASIGELRLLSERAPQQPPYPNFREGFPGVTCLDASQPRTYNAWANAANAARATGSIFSDVWIWSSSICKDWPGRDSDRFVGPYGVETANPILVMTTRFDPATPLEQAVAANEELADSALVVVNGWGHTTPFASTCGDAIVVDYVVNGVLPADGTECEADLQDPFAPQPDTAAMEGRRILAEYGRSPMWRN